VCGFLKTRNESETKATTTMSRQSPVVLIQELPGELHHTLVEAQQGALKATASDLAAVLRALLASGVLIQENGRIIPKKSNERLPNA
jgi:hypothetical protein